MKHLRTDPKGYAVPYGVVVDRDGKVHFSINDEATRLRSLTRLLCGICGTPLFRGRWLVGGALSCFHKYGAFIDPPMHSECAHYALQVCPYLSAPRYAHEVGKLKAEQAKFDATVILIDPTMIPGRPAADIFIAIMATKVEICGNFNCKPVMPYARVEFWRHGKQMHSEHACKELAQHHPELENEVTFNFARANAS